jgi:hypothetical protein
MGNEEVLVLLLPSSNKILFGGAKAIRDITVAILNIDVSAIGK